MTGTHPAARLRGPLFSSMAAHAVVVAALAGALGWNARGAGSLEPPVIQIAGAVPDTRRIIEVSRDLSPLPAPPVEAPEVHELPLLDAQSFIHSDCWWDSTEPIITRFELSVRAEPRRDLLPAAETAPTQVESEPPAPPAVVAIRVAPRVEAATCPAPEYPMLARRRGLEGVATLILQVGIDGSVISAQVVESSGHSLLDEAALDAARAWKLSPATENGVAVAGALHVPLRFRLER